MIAARLRPGAISESSSSHLPASVASKSAKPVTFPPGRSSRAMRPLATGSLMLGKTIGIVPFSRLSAKIAGAGFVMMMPHTEQLHVVERYRIIEDGKAIEAVAHVEDPGAFTMPWTAYQRYRHVEQGPLGERFAPKTMPTSLATRSSRSRPPPPRIFRVRGQAWNAGPPTGWPGNGILAAETGRRTGCRSAVQARNRDRCPPGGHEQVSSVSSPPAGVPTASSIVITVPADLPRRMGPQNQIKATRSK